ncbi:MAG: hypothetical protein ACTSX9_06945 [Candidatus Njordarchaeales archaeon]
MQIPAETGFGIALLLIGLLMYLLIRSDVKFVYSTRKRTKEEKTE